MLLLPILVAVLTRHYKKPVHLKIILFSGFSLIMEHLSTDDDTKNLFNENTNSPWYHLLTPLLFLLLTRFFSEYLDRGKHKYLAWFLPLMFLVLVILNAFAEGGLSGFPSKIIGLYSILGIVLSVGYFLHLLGSLSDYYIEKRPMFWVSSGLLVYFAGNFLLWIGLNYLNYDTGFFYSIYRINSILTFFLYSFFTIAICLDLKTDLNTPTNLNDDDDIPDKP